MTNITPFAPYQITPLPTIIPIPLQNANLAYYTEDKNNNS